MITLTLPYEFMPGTIIFVGTTAYKIIKTKNDRCARKTVITTKLLNLNIEDKNGN